MTGNLLHGWRVEEYGRSRDGVALRAFFPEGSGPTAGLLVAAQHGEEAVTALLGLGFVEALGMDIDSSANVNWRGASLNRPDYQRQVPTGIIAFRRVG